MKGVKTYLRLVGMRKDYSHVDERLVPRCRKLDIILELPAVICSIGSFRVDQDKPRKQCRCGSGVSGNSIIVFGAVQRSSQMISNCVEAHCINLIIHFNWAKEIISKKCAESINSIKLMLRLSFGLHQIWYAYGFQLNFSEVRLIRKVNPNLICS